MKILITGANGYLGQGIVKKLLDSEYEVVATDFKSEHIDKRAHVFACDLFEIENPYEYFGKPDVMLHLAWRDGFVHYSNAHVEDLPKHYEFIKKMVETGVKQVAVLGTMHEIGFFEGCIDELTPCKPSTPYGIAKNALRELGQMICKQNNVIFQWLRGYYIVGNSKFGNSVFSKICYAVEEGKKEFPFTMGQNQYDFIDYDNFVEQVVATICQSEIKGIINICSGKPEKLADRVERFIEENGYDIVLKYGAYPDREYDSKAVWADNKKIKKIMSIRRR